MPLKLISPGGGSIILEPENTGSTSTFKLPAAATNAVLMSNNFTGSATVSGTLTANVFRNTYATQLTDYRTQSPAPDSIILEGPPDDRDCWVFRDSAAGAINWGIYHRQINTDIASLPANSIGFVGNDQLAAYIDLSNKRIRSMTAVDQPYQMVVRTDGYTVPDGASNIVYNVLVHSRYMSHNSGTNMIFEQPGKYLITTGWRFGAGGDVWTGVRLLDSDGTVRGVGYGTGQVVNDPGPCQISFIADIPVGRVNQNMSMQFFRSGSTMGIGSPNTTAGYAIVTTVIQVGV